MLRNTLLSFLVVFLSGCAGSAHKLPQVSNEEVTLMQQKLANNSAVIKTYKRSHREYKQIIEEITERLIKNAEPLCRVTEYPSCYFEVSYNTDKVMNAYASELYKITLYKGLLQHLENNDEIAAVIGHEMGHHLAHHNEEHISNTNTGALLLGGVTAVLIGIGNVNNPNPISYQEQQKNRDAFQEMMGLGSTIGGISYSKEHEREADLLGAYLLARAGYDLKKAENLLVVLSNHPNDTSDKARASLFDTHPADPERLVAWEKAIEEIKNNPSKLPYPKE